MLLVQSRQDSERRRPPIALYHPFIELAQVVGSGVAEVHNPGHRGDVIDGTVGAIRLHYR
jgi:hypothetical protein